MRINKYQYKQHQEYYDGFAFLPLEDLKKHNGFVFKIYHPYPGNIKHVFDHPLNLEVIDRNCTVSIVKLVKEKGLPYVESSTTRLSGAIKALKKLMRVPSYQKAYLREQMTSVHQLETLLRLYKKNLLKALAGELQELLNSKGFTATIRVCSHDLAKVLNVMHGLDRELMPRIDTLSRLLPKPQLAGNNVQIIQHAWNEITGAVHELRKFEYIHAELIYQVKQWQNTRVIHEQQEILN